LNEDQRKYFDNKPAGKQFYKRVTDLRTAIRQDRNQKITFDWKPIEHLVEQTLDWNNKEAMNLIWSHISKTEQKYFNNKSLKSAFADSFRYQKNVLQKKKIKPPVVNPESLN
jgi:hypothetical protein